MCCVLEIAAVSCRGPRAQLGLGATGSFSLVLSSYDLGEQRARDPLRFC
jgi:hypothetical protein